MYFVNFETGSKKGTADLAVNGDTLSNTVTFLFAFKLLCDDDLIMRELFLVNDEFVTDTCCGWVLFVALLHFY